MNYNYNIDFNIFIYINPLNFIKMSCHVMNCSHPFDHVTIAHKCRECREYGHGSEECKSYIDRDLLSKYYNDRMSLENQCKFPHCRYKEMHTTSNHKCSKCHNFGKQCECHREIIKYFKKNSV